MFTRYLLVGLLLTLSWVSPAAAKSPLILLTITEPTLGQWLFGWYGDYPVSVAPAQEMNFSWEADFDIDVGATILGFRYGWDVVDYNDPDDAGWVTQGLQDVLSAPTMSFATGVHRFTVLVEDDIGRQTFGEIFITVDPALSSQPGSIGEIKGGWSE